MSSEPQPETINFRNKPVKKRLNKRTLDTLETPPLNANGKPAQLWIYDSVTPRLAVCVWSTGARTWYWVGRCNGRMIRHKVGEYPELQPDLARKLASKVSAQVANGIDPRQEKYQQRAEPTFGEFIETYLEQHAKLHKKARSWQDDEKTFRRYCTSLKPRLLSSITKQEIATLHAKVGKDHGKYAANRMLSLLSKLFSFAGQFGFPLANPCREIKKFREESRDRFLTGEELQRFFEGLLREETQLWQDFFTLALLTGARRGNLQAMRFDELNLSQATWRIPDTKAGEPLTVHLVAEAVDILQRRMEAANGCPWVFPGGRKNQTSHVKEPKTAWARICERAGLENLRLHDLRRTLGSWQAATGASLPVIGKTLGHKQQATTQIYARLNLDPVRQSVNTAVAAMMAAANGKKNDNKEGVE